ncbi:MAG: hypothetical protein JST36_11100 [Bacteroidetes bacterium]|nr:hypothetical protein [Bacteroidota bacterium]
MKKFFLFMVLPLGLSLGTSSCIKDKIDDLTKPQTNSTTPPTPSVAGGDGALVSVRVGTTTVVTGVPFTVDVESAVAAFYDASNNNSLLDGGTVKMNGFELTKSDNNSYTYMSNTNLDLNFGSGSAWTVSGAGAVPAMSYNHNDAFPKFSGTLPTSITRANGLTINLSSVSNADSVWIFIAAGDKTFTKHLGPNPGTVTLTAAELNTLPATETCIFEVIPWRYRIQNISGKDMVLIKEYAAVATFKMD